MTTDDNGSIEARAASGEHEEGDEPQGEMFPLGSIEGDAKTLKTLVKPGQKTEQTVSLMSAEVPISGGGLLDPEREGMLLVTYEPAGYTEVPVREGDRASGKRVKGWKFRTQLRPIYVERVEGEAGVLEANFAALAEGDARAAGALLDRMRARLTDALDGATPEATARGARTTA